MDTQAEVDKEHESVQRLAAVTRRSNCPAFCDLLGWERGTENPFLLLRNPGVMFESPRRIVVFQEIGGELRYYAGGWRSAENRIHLEQDRIEAEGCERGVFETIRGALDFAECYLIQEQPLQGIAVPRMLMSRRETDEYIG